MKNMRLQSLSILSHGERKAREDSFDSEVTVVIGENDVGKSHIIKSIFAAFGADAAVVNEKWKVAQAIVALQFSVNEATYTILRANNQFGLFNSDQRLLWSESSIVKGVAPRIADLLDFEIELPNRDGVLITPPPQFCFLPFYQDQDRGWDDQWASFNAVQMLPDYRRSLLEFHTGIRPREYYRARAAKAEAVRQQNELKAERKALERAAARLQAGRSAIGVPFEPSAFVEQIDRLLTELNELSSLYEDVRKKVAELQSRRAVLAEQIEIAGTALRELDQDFRFMQEVTDSEITCPTCHAVYENDFANRFGLIGDADACRGFLASARLSLYEVEHDIERHRRTMSEYQGRAETIEAILAETRGTIKLGDMLKDESERMLDVTIAEERRMIDQGIGEWLLKENEAAKIMSQFGSEKRKKEIIEYYGQKLTEFAYELGVEFTSRVSKSVSPKINETGSYGTRAILAYHYAILHTIREFTSSCLTPIILDTPLQQDQDNKNAEAIIRFIRDRRPRDMQLILGTVSLHGVEYPGIQIEPDTTFSLLRQDEYERVASNIAPLFDQMMRTDAKLPLT